jgi:hypothetical protein
MPSLIQERARREHYKAKLLHPRSILPPQVKFSLGKRNTNQFYLSDIAIVISIRLISAEIDVTAEVHAGLEHCPGEVVIVEIEDSVNRNLDTSGFMQSSNVPVDLLQWRRFRMCDQRVRAMAGIDKQRNRLGIPETYNQNIVHFNYLSEHVDLGTKHVDDSLICISGTSESQDPACVSVVLKRKSGVIPMFEIPVTLSITLEIDSMQPNRRATYRVCVRR